MYENALQCLFCLSYLPTKLFVALAIFGGSKMAGPVPTSGRPGSPGPAVPVRIFSDNKLG
jgi:hypothetical protein